MKRMLSLCAASLCLTLALTPTALAADFEPAVPDAKVCYPTSIVRNDDGTELKKIYDLSPEDDPAGIPRSDFQQDGFQYTLTDLLKQELPENESRQHTEHVSIESAKKDMESVLALLPQEREFITDDGLSVDCGSKRDADQHGDHQIAAPHQDRHAHGKEHTVCNRKRRSGDGGLDKILPVNAAQLHEPCDGDAGNDDGNERTDQRGVRRCTSVRHQFKTDDAAQYTQHKVQEKKPWLK